MNDQQGSFQQNEDVAQPTSIGAIRDQIALISFIDSILKEKGDLITDEQLPQVREALLTELNEQINTHLVSLLSPEEQEDLGDVLDRSGSDEEVDEIFLKNIPNIEVEIASVLVEFRNGYVGMKEFPAVQATPEANVPENQIETVPEPVQNEQTASAEVDDKTRNILDSLSALAEGNGEMTEPISEQGEVLMPAPPAPVGSSTN